ncbi:MAG: hypothetical protein ACD_69C00229G0002 [uncultured bacterium]|nr:MAG: hypothetical protein ACD_69C00229G0002 [uncultured bacterium]OGT09727.1 MAG: hypothetical protein A2V89_03930 [Gammaproteobacteria bacterium RBG_16_37_9]HBC71762.1 hypothetical protein [Coxiellaceae bacterium]HBS51444.1 hypothetical protein [Coxiellaceae bacterium]HBY55485.1 hypothetical protein [Coxiellaceae bacterium]
MGVSINLDQSLIDAAKSRSAVEHRSVPKQIEYWAKIGRIAAENKDLTYDAIQGILLGLADVEVGNVEVYKKGKL